jgi:hypothetical protein
MGEEIPLLRPVPPFEEIYGDGVYLSPRIAFVSRGWSRGDRSYADMLTGRFATAPGDMPRLVAAAAVTPAVARWFRLAGLPIREESDQFANEAQHEALLRAAIGRGWRIASQFPIYEDHWAAPHALNPEDLHCRLADKRSISELVPEPFRPRRSIVEGPDFTAGKVRPPLPCVAKVSSRFAATAGHGVRICLTPEELDAALVEFERAERVVIEEHLPFVATFCFHGAIQGGGRAALLGVTEQIIVDRSRYGGGWYGPDVNPPAPAWQAARAVMRRIAGTGFRGIVGLDLGVLPDGAIRAFDINPRVNASTSGLWLECFRPDLKSRHGRMQVWRSSLSWEETGAIVEPEIKAGRWIPLSVRDPALNDGPGPGPMMLGVTMGDSREEAMAACADIRSRLHADIP